MCLFHPKNSPSDISWLPEDERPGHVGRSGDPGEQGGFVGGRRVAPMWKQREIHRNSLGYNFFEFPDFWA